MQKQTYHVQGIHCNSCKILIEDIVEETLGIPGVVLVKEQTLTCDCEDSETSERYLNELIPLLQEHGYTLSVERGDSVSNDGLIWQAIPIGLIVLILFIVLQKSGILNFSAGGIITPTASFMIGLVASISSCLAVVGGLILSLSAQFGTQGKRGKLALVSFHSARILGFALFGGILGMIGKAVGINTIFSAILGIVASLVMILLGLNLSGILQKNLTLPSTFFTIFRKKGGVFLMPILIGIGTFFLPCGFTQSMQIASLSSGSFIGGLLIMLFFALGTFPVLAILSFGSASFSQSKHAPLFMKTIGIIVIGFGILTLGTGLVGLGIMPAFINF